MKNTLGRWTWRPSFCYASECSSSKRSGFEVIRYETSSQSVKYKCGIYKCAAVSSLWVWDNLNYPEACEQIQTLAMFVVGQGWCNHQPDNPTPSLYCHKLLAWVKQKSLAFDQAQIWCFVYWDCEDKQTPCCIGTFHL